MPAANGFWTAEENEAYNKTGAIPGQEQHKTAMGGDNAMYQTDPTGQASNQGSWQWAGTQGKAVWTPYQSYGAPGNANAYGQMYRDLGLIDTMSYSPTQAGTHPAAAGEVPQFPVPPRMRMPNLPAGAPNIAGTPGTVPQSVNDQFSNFMSWWNGGSNNQFQPGSAMGPNRAAATGMDPATAALFGMPPAGQTDYGSYYNQFKVPTPFTYQGGQMGYLPGDPTQTYNMDLMRGNPGLFTAGYQANQLTQGQRPEGPLHPFIPPWLAQSQGLGPQAYQGAPQQWSPAQQSTYGAWPPNLGAYGQAGIHLPFGWNPNYLNQQLPQPRPTSAGTAQGGPRPAQYVGSGAGGSWEPGPGEGPPIMGPGGSNPLGGGGIQPSAGPAPVGTSSYSSSPDQALAYGAGDLGYLRGMAQNAGYPTNVGPAWDAMVAAQQRSLDRRFADLQESFNTSGNRFGTAYGSAATDFQNQAGLEQNALLGQLSTQAQEAARGRELQAGGQLGQFGFQGLQQLSGQDFQSQMLQRQQALQAAQALFGGGQGAAQLMAQLGGQGAMALLGGSIQGAQGLFGAQNQAAMAEAQRQMWLQQLGQQGAGQLSQLWQQNLGLGSQLGGQQYALQQDQINRQYQEWLRTQPYNNPMLAYMYSAATGYPPYHQPQYAPSQFGQILGGFGSLFGSLFPNGLPGMKQQYD